MSDQTPVRYNVYGYPMRTAEQVPRRVLGIQMLARWKNEPDSDEINQVPTLWLRRLVGTLFQSFVTAALPGQPAAEMLPHTAQLWVDVLLDMRLSEDDAERVQIAGRKLLRELEEWPQVKALISALPARRDAKSCVSTTTGGPTEADRQAGREALAKLKEMF